jgi:hypothetical protein
VTGPGISSATASVEFFRSLLATAASGSRSGSFVVPAGGTASSPNSGAAGSASARLGGVAASSSEALGINGGGARGPRDVLSSFVGSVSRAIFWSDISAGAGVGLVACDVGSGSLWATTGSGTGGSGATGSASLPASGRETASGVRAPLTVAPSDAPAGVGGRTMVADGAITLASGIRRGARDGSRGVDARGIRATTGGAVRSVRRGSSSPLGGEIAAEGAPEIALASTRKMSGFGAAGSVASFNPNATTMIWISSEPEVQSGRFEPRR